MHSELIAAYLNDIIQSVELIRKWVLDAGGIRPAVFENELTRSAIERKLLIVSEAAIRMDRLDAQIGPTRAPEVNWSGVRGIGNVLRHRYDGLDDQIVADVLGDRLDELEAACRRLLAGL